MTVIVSARDVWRGSDRVYDPGGNFGALGKPVLICPTRATEATGQKDIMQKRVDSSAAAASAAAARVVVARTLGRLELRVDSFFVEALVVEFALLRVAENI